MKPIIGITSFNDIKSEKTFCEVGYSYINSIILSGGIPVVIPIIHDEEALKIYLEMIDGLLLTGGGDIAPLLYGENPTEQVDSISWERDRQEIALCNFASEMGIPIFGICRGLQVINVAFGGTLYQDIHKQIDGTLGHSPSATSRDQLYHSVKIDKDSKLYSIFREDEIHVNSFHHQAAKDLGKGLKISAFSTDGIIEAIESQENNFIVGVQWHPEDLVVKHPKFLSLFISFVEESKKAKKGK